jgi:hypothetical protein
MTSCKTSLCPFKDCCDRVKLNPAFGDTYMIDPYEVVNGVTVCDIYIGEPKEYKRIKRSQIIKNVLKH